MEYSKAISLDGMKKRVASIEEYLSRTAEEIKVYNGTISELQCKLDTCKHEAEWALKELDELRRSIRDLEDSEEK